MIQSIITIYCIYEQYEQENILIKTTLNTTQGGGEGGQAGRGDRGPQLVIPFFYQALACFSFEEGPTTLFLSLEVGAGV